MGFKPWCAAPRSRAASAWCASASAGPKNLPNGNVIRGGIEFDKISRRVAYHLYREHPGERLMFFNAGETTRVPANSVLHIYKPLRPGQYRPPPGGHVRGVHHREQSGRPRHRE